MLARGALGNPWLFAELLGGRECAPTRAEVVRELDWTIARAVEHLGEPRATRYLRKFYPWYVMRLRLDSARGQAARRRCRNRRRCSACASCSRRPQNAAPRSPHSERAWRARGLFGARYTAALARAVCREIPAGGTRSVTRRPNYDTAIEGQMPKDIILTPEGLKKLKDELELLSTEKRREVAERIKEAREFGDISENSEYDDAKNEQAMIESRIAQLQEKLRMASVIETKDLSTDVVQVGSVVHVKDEKTGKSVKYTIVGSAEAKPEEEKLSNESPVGRALIGRKRNETVAVKVPRGPARKLKITKIDVGAEVGLAAMSGVPTSDERARVRRAGETRPARADRRAPRKGRAPEQADPNSFPYTLRRRADRRSARRLRASGGGAGDRGAPSRRRPSGCAPRLGRRGVSRPRRPQRQDPAARAPRRAR